jgi:hypothetical protein
MKTWKNTLPAAAALLLLAGAALAQSDQEEAEREAALHAAEAREIEIEQKLADAEARMAEAAREIAEITSERLPQIHEIEQRFVLYDKPRLGVTIDSNDKPGPVEGVVINGVTPGSAAADAGLRSGDIITAVNGESLQADSCEAANMRLLDFMTGVEEGDVLELNYLRDGKSGSVQVEPRVVPMEEEFWVQRVPRAPDPVRAPVVVKNFDFAFPWAGTGLGNLELVELNEGLGRYFGTATGLLVVSAPKSDAFKLQEGDVIQSIDGREPKDVRHAMRILSSYQSGEKLQLGIMRDMKKLTLDVEIPADQRGNVLYEFDDEEFDIEVRPAATPHPAAPAATHAVPHPAPGPAPLRVQPVAPLVEPPVIETTT